MSIITTRARWLPWGMLLVWLGSLVTLSYAAGEEWGPWGGDRRYTQEVTTARSLRHSSHPVSSITTLPLSLLITFFQEIISPVDGATCDFYPTCSAYAKQALKKHGLLLGLAMASERITRDHAPHGYELIHKFGRDYLYDPVEHNDFWFRTTEGKVR